MDDKNLIHIKFEYEEGLKSKRDMLSSEMSLLKIANIIKRYHFLRLEELEIKLKLYRKIKEIITSIRKLQTTLPKLKIPEILRRGYEESDEPKIKEAGERKYDESIESQLQEIQDKLNTLQR